jgi:hypothetical protein
MPGDVEISLMMVTRQPALHGVGLNGFEKRPVDELYQRRTGEGKRKKGEKAYVR